LRHISTGADLCILVKDIPVMPLAVNKPVTINATIDINMSMGYYYCDETIHANVEEVG
jgi:hypothetical protein